MATEENSLANKSQSFINCGVKSGTIEHFLINDLTDYTDET